VTHAFRLLYALGLVASLLTGLTAAGARAQDQNPARRAEFTGPMTYEQFKANRLAAIERMSAVAQQRLARPDLTAEQRQRLAQIQARLARFQSMSPPQLDQMLRRRFDRIDVNHTGIITPAQIQAVREQERRAHAARAAGNSPVAAGGTALARPLGSAAGGSTPSTPPPSGTSGDSFWPRTN